MSYKESHSSFLILQDSWGRQFHIVEFKMLTKKI